MVIAVSYTHLDVYKRQDLAYAARTVSGAYATYWEPYLTISLVYWVITFLLAQLVNRLVGVLYSDS